jgi:hypothetical protein
MRWTTLLAYPWLGPRESSLNSSSPKQLDRSVPSIGQLNHPLIQLDRVTGACIELVPSESSPPPVSTSLPSLSKPSHFPKPSPWPQHVSLSVCKRPFPGGAKDYSPWYGRSLQDLALSVSILRTHHKLGRNRADCHGGIRINTISHSLIGSDWYPDSEFACHVENLTGLSAQ